MHEAYSRSSIDIFSMVTFLFLYILFYIVDLVFKFIKNKKLVGLMFILSVITLLFILFNPISLSLYKCILEVNCGLGFIYFFAFIPLFIFFVVMTIVYYKRWKAVDNNLTEQETSITTNVIF